MKSRNAVKFAMKLAKCCFIMLHSSGFGKVRELVGEIKYAFATRHIFIIKLKLLFTHIDISAIVAYCELWRSLAIIVYVVSCPLIKKEQTTNKNFLSYFLQLG